MIDHIEAAERALQMGDTAKATAHALIAIAIQTTPLIFVEDIALNLEAEEEDEE